MLRKLLMLVCVVAYPLGAAAAWFGAEFSADVVQYNPQTRQWQVVGKIAVGKDKMRLDNLQQKQWMLIDGKRHVTYMVMPQQRAYMEMPGVQAVPMLAAVPLPNDPESPCAQGKMTCKKVGEEEIGGIKVEKWEFVTKQGGRTQRSYQWIDPQRGMAIKQEFPGFELERRYLGKAKVRGRQVEKWAITVRQRGRTEKGIEYIDPELKVVLRREHGGQVTELRNIKVGPQPKSLFTIPAGYHKQAPPRGMGYGR
ncbi:MAG: hypothetical protein D6819_01790 [Gammaproteobacteria bacterium]|nr:MAG: hypothetical protein D6819_01790 [Gammaproteobacteria bacterium]